MPRLAWPKTGVEKARKAHIYTKDPHSYYSENVWCSERIFDVEAFTGTVHDPACGSGRVVRAARHHGLTATGSDIVARSRDCDRVLNFLQDDHVHQNIVSNPPYHLCDNKTNFIFVRHALAHARWKAVLLLPLTWIASDERADWLENQSGLRRVWVLTPRPAMPPGLMLEEGMKASGGRVDFAWYVFDRHCARRRSDPQIRILRRDG